MLSKPVGKQQKVSNTKGDSLIVSTETVLVLWRSILRFPFAWPTVLGTLIIQYLQAS